MNQEPTIHVMPRELAERIAAGEVAVMGLGVTIKAPSVHKRIISRTCGIIRQSQDTDIAK
jgi:hypothetical protein